MNFLNKLSYTKYVLFHPFDGFYEIKFRERGDAFIASLFFLLYAIMSIVAAQYNGFIINYNNIKRMNSLLIVLYSVLPYLIFVVGNYSITTLFNGKGTMREIYIVVGYALVPLIIGQLIGVIFSQFITLDEVSLYGLVKSATGLWFAFLLFTGLVTIHEYGVFKNIATIFATFVAISIILFLILLGYSLIQQVIAFIQIFIKEAVIRIEEWLQ